MPAYSPKDALVRHGETIPEELLAVVNKFLAERIHKGQITITRKELADALQFTQINESEALERGWLDFEELYRAQGWKVTYDKPGFNETYVGFWLFEAKQDGRS